MISKVERMRRMADDGYRLQGVDSRDDGGVRVRLARRGHEIVLDFEHYEIPAILHATKQLAFAS